MRPLPVLLCSALAGALLLVCCERKAGEDRTSKTASSARAERRLYDGAPPVVPHGDFGPNCIACHTATGMEIPGEGFAPAMPHGDTHGLSEKSRCLQCHVFKSTEDVFRENTFAGIAQDLRRGKRLHPYAPPVIPHGVLMRENCVACHDGPSAREEIRCSHVERTNCRQCHVAAEDAGRFAR